ncbi:MAG: DUF362 domain-containing protein [Polyangiaceae bacterium]|nr:DUF362 domain-containing protein [Polyangiaceae bacterium]
MQIARRHWVQGAAAVGLGAAGLGAPRRAFAVEDLVASPPAGFVPASYPGRVVKVEKSGDFASMMQPNQLWPKPEIARALLERAMTELTGSPNLVAAMRKVIHPEDRVAIKPNGIAGQVGATMAVNFELILPLVEAVIAVGVKPENVMVYEQYYLTGCRVGVKGYDLPKGVKTANHGNANHPMPRIAVYPGIRTRYCKQLLDATAVIDMTQIKDHSICGYTGTLKNITHGTIDNPEEHHATHASPHIALLYNHPIVTSRVRLHVTDAFKIMYDKGPLDKDPATRIPHGAVYVSTDPVAMDVFGASLVEKERKERGLPTLTEARRPARYLETAADLGLGVGRLDAVRLRSFVV